MSRKITVGIKTWLEVDGRPALGQGKAELLMEIYDTGSLSAAARNLGISYHRAHDMISELNEIFGKDILVSSVGGASGGGTELTPTGRMLVEQYRKIRDELEFQAENFPLD